MKTWVFWLEIFISNLANFMKLPYLFSEHCHLWTFVEFQATCQTFSYFWKETNKFRWLRSAKMNHNQLTRSPTPYRNDDFYSQNNTKNKTRKKKNLTALNNCQIIGDFQLTLTLFCHLFLWWRLSWGEMVWVWLQLKTG